nr:MAG TPA: hypothetical protein [Caudoviricetes sp.]
MLFQSFLAGQHLKIGLFFHHWWTVLEKFCLKAVF